MFRFNFIAAINLNVSNFIQNIFRYAFNPYTSIFGNLTWGIIFGFIGAGLFIGSRSVQTAFTYLILVGIVFGLILPQAIIGIFGLMVVFIATSAFYVVFVEGR